MRSFVATVVIAEFYSFLISTRTDSIPGFVRLATYVALSEKFLAGGKISSLPRADQLPLI